MARIQILELPSEEGGDGKIITPFALIVDQCTAEELEDGFGEAIAKFRDMCGARAAIATDSTLDLVGLSAEEIATISQRPHPADWEPIDKLRGELIDKLSAGRA